MNILDEIVAYKKSEIELSKKKVSLHQLKDSELYNRKGQSLSIQLTENSGSIISEFKRKSPSVNNIKKDAQPSHIIPSYIEGGAAAISVLTDNKYFQGSLSDLKNVRSMTSLPLLRKDFIIDPYQIHEAKSYGADLILLIAHCLEKSIASELVHLAHSLDLEVLYEIHDPEELLKMPEEINILGVNNRNLKTFKVDYRYAIEIFGDLPENKLKISESGINSMEAFKDSIHAGFKACLIGEYLMKENNPSNTIQSLLKSTHNEN